jgi:hypothetical protein
MHVVMQQVWQQGPLDGCQSAGGSARVFKECLAYSREAFWQIQASQYHDALPATSLLYCHCTE